MSNQNFDGLSERFQKNIYAQSKGQLRLALLQQELDHWLPERGQDLAIDLGCGLGHMSVWLAKRGYQVFACDISDEMISFAYRHALSTSLAQSISFSKKSLQKVIIPDNQICKLIVCHAVLEWTEDPHAALAHLAHLTPSGGLLSLMFYNVDGLIWRNLIKGNFKKVESGNFRGEKGGLTPINPLSNATVRTWSQELGLVLLRQRGIRVIHDYLSRDLRDKRSFEDMLRLESEYSLKAPYRDLGCYTHLMLQKPLKPEA